MACIFYYMPYVFFRVGKSFFQHALMPLNCTGILHVFRHVSQPMKFFVLNTMILKKHLCI